MHQLPNRLASLAVVAGFAWAAGCFGDGREFAPEVPGEGSWYVYDSHGGAELRLTYAGIDENYGGEWHKFREEGFVGLQIGSITYLDPATGGRPFSDDERVSETEFTPFMEWHRQEGH